MSELAGATAIVTGAAQGLGRAIARAYVDAGMRVALLDLRADLLEELARELGPATQPFCADLCDAEATRAVIAQALDSLGTPRVLVHNAALLKTCPLPQLSLEHWKRELNVGIQAAFLLTQAVWPGMCAAGGGSLVYLSSRSGVEGFVDEAAYCSAKHAIEGFMKCMALEGRPHNIAANTITPGMAMRTPMSERNYSPEYKRIWVDPARLTPAFLTLARQDAGGLSGQRLNAWEMSGQGSAPLWGQA